MPTLWQTSLLRGTRLTVLDEVANGLSYYDYTFLREVPRLYARAGRPTAGAGSGAPARRSPPSSMGSWIGGDRDGNPFVTADVLRQAARTAQQPRPRFYLDELHQLGGELSLDARVVGVSDELEPGGAFARSLPARREEPYRCAISGIYARVAATLRRSMTLDRARAPVGDGTAPMRERTS